MVYEKDQAIMEYILSRFEYDKEDNAQEAWMKILESHTSSKEDIDRICKEVSKKSSRDFFHKRYKEISMQQPLSQDSPDFTMEDLLSNQLEPEVSAEVPDFVEKSNKKLFNKVIDFLAYQYAGVKRENALIKSDRIRIREEEKTKQVKSVADRIRIREEEKTKQVIIRETSRMKRMELKTLLQEKIIKEKSKREELHHIRELLRQEKEQKLSSYIATSVVNKLVSEELIKHKDITGYIVRLGNKTHKIARYDSRGIKFQCSRESASIPFGEHPERGIPSCKTCGSA